MRITSVPPARASDSQSTPPGRVSSPTWPVTTVTEVDRPRWVTGIPAAAGTAIAEVTPGTTSQGTPAWLDSASASSPPRPNRNGSPPFSRTTVRAVAAVGDQESLISSWRAAPSRPRPRGASADPAGRLPASTRTGAAGREREQRVVDQPVVDDDVGPGQHLGALPGEQPGSPGPAPTR